MSDQERLKGYVYTEHLSDSSSRAVTHYVVHKAGCKRIKKKARPFADLVAKLGDKIGIKIAVGSVRPCHSCKPGFKE